MTLLSLAALPCGCVFGLYRAEPGVVELGLLEARGPYCVRALHRQGAVVQFGVADDEGFDGRIEGEIPLA